MLRGIGTSSSELNTDSKGVSQGESRGRASEGSGRYGEREREIDTKRKYSKVTKY